MDSTKWKTIKDVFAAVVELPPPERGAVLNDTDTEIRVEVERLLHGHEQALQFIEKPIFVEKGLAESVETKDNYIGKKIGNYLILEKIGAGGMGAVYLAGREGFEQRVAIKLIKRGMDSEAIVKRFFLERRILSRLNHPFITRLFDGGTTADGLPYFVMEHVDGLPLLEFCSRHEFDTGERLDLFLRICSAVSFAHQNLVVHRDLKPSNILVTHDGTPKLLDFGIAKLLDTDSEATATQARILTPEYASPEQLNGLPITTSADVYSLGVVLYELLSGTRPFTSESKNYQEIVNLVLSKEPVRPSVVVSSQLSVVSKKTGGIGQLTTNDEQRKIPKSKIQNPKFLRGDIDNIVLKALRKEPERRYASVQEFAEDIKRNLAGLPVTATADSPGYRFRKFVGRNKIGTAIAALFLFLAGVSIWQGMIANRERGKAEKRLTEIRGLAKSLMNETNDSLKKIPGNIAMQKALAEKSVALLDSLANDETNDATLLVELADAYTKFAEIQNLSFREYDKSITNLKKVEAIYKKILQTDPGNVKIRRSLYAAQMRITEALRYSNRREELFLLDDEIIENQQELIRLEPENTSHRGNLAAVFGLFGEIAVVFEKKEESAKNFQKGIEIIDQAIERQKSKDGSPKSRAEVARFYLIKGWLLKGSGEKERAIENYRNAAGIAAQVFLEDATVPENFYRVVGSYDAIGDIYESEGNFEAALESYLQATTWAKTGLQNKDLPNPGGIQFVECACTVEAAKMFDRLGKQTEAWRHFTEGETLCRQNLERNAAQRGVLIDQIDFFFEIGDFYFKSGESKKGIALLLELKENMERVLEINEWDFKSAFTLADIFEKLGDYHSGRQAQEFYEKSNGIWTKYHQSYTLLPAELKKMEAVRKKIQSL